MPALWELPANTLVPLLEIQFHIDVHNQEVEQARHYFQLTFTNLDAANRAVVESNLRAAYLNIARRQKMLAGKIDAALQNLRRYRRVGAKLEVTSPLTSPRYSVRD
jgi:Na+/phosphate symporter